MVLVSEALVTHDPFKRRMLDIWSQERSIHVAGLAASSLLGPSVWTTLATGLMRCASDDPAPCRQVWDTIRASFDVVTAGPVD